jgi:hypothetical protein
MFCKFVETALIFWNCEAPTSTIIVHNTLNKIIAQYRWPENCFALHYEHLFTLPSLNILLHCLTVLSLLTTNCARIIYDGFLHYSRFLHEEILLCKTPLLNWTPRNNCPLHIYFPHIIISKTAESLLQCGLYSVTSFVTCFNLNFLTAAIRVKLYYYTYNKGSH